MKVLLVNPWEDEYLPPPSIGYLQAALKHWRVPNTEIHRKAKECGFNDNVYLESGAPFYTYEQDMSTLKNWEYQIMTAK